MSGSREKPAWTPDGWKITFTWYDHYITTVTDLVNPSQVVIFLILRIEMNLYPEV